MTRKIITGVIAAVLVVTIAVFAAEKVKEKAFAESPKAKASEQQEQREGLLDQLVAAYKANDKDKMGKIINKMQERREKMQEFAKTNGWRRWAPRQMMGPGFAPNDGAMQGGQMGQGQQMAGPGWNQGCSMQNQGYNQCCAMNGPRENCGWAMQGPGQNQGCLPYRDDQATMAMAGPQCGQFQPMRGHGFGGCNNMMGNYGVMAGPQNEAIKGWGCGPGFSNGMGNCGAMPGQNFGQMPCQQGGMGMGNCMPQQNGPGQMRGCERGGFQKNCTQGQDAGDMEQQEQNMPRRERQNNVPPPEWGW